jgi:hypothetical protein
MVGVVTGVPAGHLFDPREVKDTSAPVAVDTPYRSASHASTWTSDVLAAADDGTVLVSPMRQTSWVKP